LIGTTPQLGIQLKAGAHEVRLINPQFAMQKTFKVDVRAGESVTRSENLGE
jgi:transposase